MTVDDTRGAILDVLAAIAPEASPDDIDDEQPLREQVDLDSMDWLNFLVGIHKRFAVAIPERDYATLSTVTDLVTYLQKHAVVGRET